MTTETSPKNLFAKMALILKAIERIPKRGRNPHFNYDYVLDADVLESVRNQFAEHGVAFFVSVADFRQEREQGSKTIKTIVGIDATFADADSGESFTVRWIGEADDQQDKGTNKALTAGVKYGLIKTFLIPTGDDDADASGSAPAPQRSRPAQQKTTAQKPPPNVVPMQQKPPAGKPGLYVMTFGKYGPPQAKTIAEIAEGDRQYLEWVVANTTNHPEDVAAIKAFLNMTNESAEKPADGPDIGKLRADFQDAMEAAFPELKGITAINNALKAKGKPAVQEMSVDQLQAGIDWAKEKKGT